MYSFDIHMVRICYGNELRMLVQSMVWCELVRFFYSVIIYKTNITGDVLSIFNCMVCIYIKKHFFSAQ